MPYDYDLVLAMPSGSQREQMIITTDTRLVAMSVGKQVWRQLPPVIDDDYDSDLEPPEPPPVLIKGKEVDILTLEPGASEPGGKWLPYFAKLNEAKRSRLVLFGHGDRMSTRVGGRDPDTLASFLVNKCKLARVTRISLVACYAGGDFVAYMPPEHSFAAKFQLLLGRPYGVFTEVTARTSSVKSAQDNTRELTKHGYVTETKSYRTVWQNNEPFAYPQIGKGTWEHRRIGGKYRFFWASQSQGGQKIERVY
jgi:hypothetical protein